MALLRPGLLLGEGRAPAEGGGVLWGRRGWGGPEATAHGGGLCSGLSSAPRPGVGRPRPPPWTDFCGQAPGKGGSVATGLLAFTTRGTGSAPWGAFSAWLGCEHRCAGLREGAGGPGRCRVSCLALPGGVVGGPGPHPRPTGRRQPHASPGPPQGLPSSPQALWGCGCHAERCLEELGPFWCSPIAPGHLSGPLSKKAVTRPGARGAASPAAGVPAPSLGCVHRGAPHRARRGAAAGLARSGAPGPAAAHQPAFEDRGSDAAGVSLSGRLPEACVPVPPPGQGRHLAGAV